MQVLMKQGLNEKYRVLGSVDLLCTEIGVWEPLVVETHEEKDYLDAYLMMLGKSAEICIDGIDKPKTDTPPTWISIPGAKQ